jgi:hypothetical protein
VGESLLLFVEYFSNIAASGENISF